jgi:hypothetical protein
MSPELVALLIQLAIRLAPVLDDALEALAKQLVALIPDVNRDFAWGCLDITRGIYVDHPDWSEDQKQRYARDAITNLARDMMVPVP